MWNKPKATGAVVGSLASVLLIFGWLDYSVVTLVCRVLQFLMVGYGVALKLDKPVLTSDDVVAHTTKAVEQATPYLTKFIAAVARVVMWEDAWWSLKVLGASMGVAAVGNVFSDLTLIFIISVAIFVLPKTYASHKEACDGALGSLKTKVDGLIGTVPNAGAVKKAQ